jgi:predicted O-methyltransferase YrrM
MYPLDVSFLPVPDENQHDPKIGMQGWGYLPYDNPQLQEWVSAIGREHKIKTMFEIGTFAGYSTTMFLEHLYYLNKIITIDPNRFSIGAGIALEERYGHRVEYKKIKSTDYGGTWDERYDMVFIDGNHSGDVPYLDIQLALSFNPKVIMMDNIELPDVQRAVKKSGLFDLIYNPDYFYYTNEHRGRRQPGILGAFNVRNTL